MTALIERIRREPVLISQCVGLVISLAASFGLSLSQEQTAAVMGVAVFIAALIGRQQVTPNTSVAAKVEPGPPADVVAGPAADVPAGDPVTVEAVDTPGRHEAP